MGRQIAHIFFSKVQIYLSHTTFCIICPVRKWYVGGSHVFEIRMRTTLYRNFRVRNLNGIVQKFKLNSRSLCPIRTCDRRAPYVKPY
jgi:hypothetical protein